jgi:hypothetical protein
MLVLADKVGFGAPLHADTRVYRTEFGSPAQLYEWMRASTHGTWTPGINVLCYELRLEWNALLCG